MKGDKQHWFSLFDQVLCPLEHIGFGALHIYLDDVGAGQSSVRYQVVQTHRRHLELLALGDGAHLVAFSDPEPCDPGPIGNRSLQQRNVLLTVQLHVPQEVVRVLGQRLECLYPAPVSQEPRESQGKNPRWLLHQTLPSEV
jgi:hypothetical protein